jgi:hypothetical protein
MASENVVLTTVRETMIADAQMRDGRGTSPKDDPHRSVWMTPG